MAGVCECGNQPSVSIKGREYLVLVEDLLVSQERLCSVQLVIFMSYIRYINSPVDSVLVSNRIIKKN